MIANRLKFDDDNQNHDDRRRPCRPSFQIVDDGQDWPTVSVALWPAMLAGAFAAGVLVGGVLVVLA